MSIKIQGDTVIFNDKSIRPANMTTAQRSAITSPQPGMIVFDTDYDKYFTYNGTSWELMQSALEVLIATPTITVEGSPSSVPGDPFLTGSAFTLTQGSGTHLSTDWEVRRTSDNVLVYSSYNDTVNKTSINVPKGNLVVNTSYAFRARYRSSTGFTSSYGSTTATTVAAFGPTVLGQSYCGGFYLGTICAASTCYYLIVAPNATGCACCQWKTTNTSTSGTASLVDGYSNTRPALANATHPAGNWTATRTINGFSDWYLPAKDELNQLYINSPGAVNTNLPAGEGFAADFYWSSTENSSTFSCSQCFNNGSINNYFKTRACRVRAVRREPI